MPSAKAVDIPSGWGVDADGEDTTDPDRVAAMLPVGEYKGSGLGLMIDVLVRCSAACPSGPIFPRCIATILPSTAGWAAWSGRSTSAASCRWTISTPAWPNLSPASAPFRRGFPAAKSSFPASRKSVPASGNLREGVTLGLQTIEELDRAAAEFGLEPLAVQRAPQGTHIFRPASKSRASVGL